jgi:hypothetical protein
MVMRMLHHGGMDVYAENHLSYEHNQDQRKLAKLMPECQGKAVKVIDPQRWNLPPGYEYDVIWLDRNITEQAKSMLKFLKYVAGLPVKGNNHEGHQMMASLICDRPKAMQHLQAVGARVLVLEFETVLRAPEYAATGMAEFLGAELDIESMAKQVVRRSPECYPGFLELEIGELERDF